MKQFLSAVALLAIASCSPPAQEAAPAPIIPVETEAPSGAYVIDTSHMSVLFRVDHLGFALYTTNFTAVTADLALDTAEPARSQLNAGVDVRSLELDNAPAGFVDIMMGENFFDAARFPQLTFRSTSVELTGADTARVTGDFTLRGVTRPLTLEVRFNGGYAGHPLEPRGRVGFSATGALKRSEFGMGFGVPAPGSTMGVGDDVEIAIEVEFTGPPLAE